MITITRAVFACLITLSFSRATLIRADTIEGGDRLTTSAYVAWDHVAAPMGRFVLIRKGKDVCAVRFTAFHRGHDEKPSTMVNTGEETLYAEYDWYWQKDGTGEFIKLNVKSGHNRLRSGPLRGFGSFAFQTGDIRIRCGPFRLFWNPPASVAFFGVPKQGDYGVELSPTPWDDMKEVNVHEPSLKWYRYDENRKTIRIPIAELSKSEHSPMGSGDTITSTVPVLRGRDSTTTSSASRMPTP